jgi:hypothetical protein
MGSQIRRAATTAFALAVPILAATGLDTQGTTMLVGDTIHVKASWKSKHAGLQVFLLEPCACKGVRNITGTQPPTEYKPEQGSTVAS